ncbi:MAG: hypothetical protein A3E91_01445 [Candidatus Moranbacteria bacterium RIFCSPHIGHO2_12_FULL_40_10]|nr:MAG: hypothetical protein A3E91_01445 [Candidatus Moranbacteria bacterium RIFCSPHIGHO2_12_FULL_40_10]
MINKEKHQIFLFVCPGNIPFNFASHPWFVVNNQGLVSRWEVLFRKIQCETSWGHLYKNFFPPFQGIEIIPFSQKYFWEGKLLGKIEGGTAKRMVKFIESSPAIYPYCNKYFLSGPNSNTYAQWILDNFPEFKVKLPWNYYFGRNYKVREFAAKEQNL